MNFFPKIQQYLQNLNFYIKGAQNNLQQTLPNTKDGQNILQESTLPYKIWAKNSLWKNTPFFYRIFTVQYLTVFDYNSNVLLFLVIVQFL